MHNKDTGGSIIHLSIFQAIHMSLNQTNFVTDLFFRDFFSAKESMFPDGSTPQNDPCGLNRLNSAISIAARATTTIIFARFGREAFGQQYESLNISSRAPAKIPYSFVVFFNNYRG